MSIWHFGQAMRVPIGSSHDSPAGRCDNRD
jgi:hypothetical protein